MFGWIKNRLISRKLICTSRKPKNIAIYILILYFQFSLECTPSPCIKSFPQMRISTYADLAYVLAQVREFFVNQQYSPTNAIFLCNTFFSRNPNARNADNRCIFIQLICKVNKIKHYLNLDLSSHDPLRMLDKVNVWSTWDIYLKC